jgi:hypothetical protein
MKACIIPLASLVLCALLAGCTAVSLERRTANQAMTGTDMRYQLVLDTMAKMATNAGNLPSLGSATDGQAFVIDSINLDAKTALISLKGFNGEALNGTASRSPQNNWTIDPVHIPEQIRALQAACFWVLTGNSPKNGTSYDQTSYQFLQDFQVADELECLVDNQPGWFCVGCKDNAPKKCCYVGHHCNTYVWVTPDGLKGLSEFTLILTDIATIDPSTLHGSATVGVFPQKDGKLGDKALFTRQVFFRTADNGKTVQLQGPVVCYGDPDQAGLHINGFSSAFYCDAMPPYGVPRDSLLDDQIQKEQLNNRVFQPTGPNAAYNVRQQQQNMMQLQQLQSFR